jgi:hypothetical protein
MQVAKDYMDSDEVDNWDALYGDDSSNSRIESSEVKELVMDGGSLRAQNRQRNRDDYHGGHASAMDGREIADGDDDFENPLQSTKSKLKSFKSKGERNIVYDEEERNADEDSHEHPQNKHASKSKTLTSSKSRASGRGEKSSPIKTPAKPAALRSRSLSASEERTPRHAIKKTFSHTTPKSTKSTSKSQVRLLYV